MSTITFDTHKFIRTLRDAGFEERQAEAMSSAFRDAITDSALVTKIDLDLAVAEIKTDFGKLDARVTGELALVKWMLAVLLALAVANFAKQFF
ncbi:MAG: hypothetical protein CO126_11750 [Hydrogenophilales bacterium CG_4_9_14_3_um_filter_63_34]|nr:MAG: hypothetical protein COZ24_11370 [Hydrogenophilales bacterium CG_4_10_14_3_um_filter_63_21]PJB02487.1 MAG: hypothetical protein CO126_11750 [Hydrogenophilales bacterium CG_4_9_14_3_um_filter_63_34]